MVWFLTRTDHNLAIRPAVRRWLRLGGFSKLLIVLVLSLAVVAFWMVARVTGSTEWGGVLGILFWVIWVVGIAEVVLDAWIPRREIKQFCESPDTALATRGEYIGGHPLLPHGRFVYLTLSGTRENPNLKIVLPRGGDAARLTFSMPLLDLQETSETRKRTGSELGITIGVGDSLAELSFRRRFMGEQAFLNITYAGSGGRKHVVQLGNFLLGDDEVQSWRNYLVCSQAEADTGKEPYGPWKSLPSGKR